MTATTGDSTSRAGVHLSSASSDVGAPEPRPAHRRLGTRERWLLVALLLGAALVRSAVIWMPSDQMLEYGRLPFEEVLRGNATSDFLHGTLLPLLDYQINHFSGGSLVVSILAVPLFVIGGPLFPVLRLTSLFFSLPLVLLMFALVDRWHSRRAAWTAALLIAFAPPGYQFLNCTVYGTHLEGNLVTIGLVFLYLRWRGAGRGGLLATLLLGVASGFAVWFGYGQCIILALLLMVELAASGLRATLSTAVRFSLGFLIGLGPWIAYMLQHPDLAFRIYDRSVVEHLGPARVFSNALDKIGPLFTNIGPRAFWLHGVDPELGLLVARILCAAIVVVVARAAWLERAQFLALARALLGRRAGFTPTLRLLSLLYIATWFIAFVLTDFWVDYPEWVLGYRYLMPLCPFLAILAGMAIQDVHARGARRLATAVVVLACALNVGATLVQVRPDRLQKHAREPATSNLWYVRMIVRRFGGDPPAMLSILQRIDQRRPEPERSEMAENIAKGIASVAARTGGDPEFMGPNGPSFAHTLRVLAAEAPAPFRPEFQRQLALQTSTAPPK